MGTLRSRKGFSGLGPGGRGGRPGHRTIGGLMKVGVPAEVKNHEFRVAITPAGVHELTRAGHLVFIEAGAGAGSSLPDEEFTAAGATILPAADDVWGAGELVLKVKEPAPAEYHRMRPGQVLFTYLHLAASRECTQPLLAPMSEVAGRMAPQVGAHHRPRGGGAGAGPTGGVLMGGATGLYAAK